MIRFKYFLAGVVGCLLTALQVCAAEKPTVSTDGNEVWYLIRFMNGGNALTATTEGADIATTSTTGQDSQWWKVCGNDTDGYTLTNKLGLTLYTNSGAKNDMVKAAAAPTKNTKFIIATTSHSGSTGGYEIQPKNNRNVSMNLWGGPSENRGVGLWDKGDINNPVTFTSETEYKATGGLSIVPYPQSLKATSEEKLDFASLKSFVCPDATMKTHAEEFAADWQKVSGIALEMMDTDNGTPAIRITTDASLPTEGYRLQTTTKGVEISAATPAGFFYALQTLKQMLPREFFAKEAQQGVAWKVPCVEIEDNPVLGHRGFMMDIARHFFNKEEVMRTLDIMALYKLNRLHWHLTDDQGWRIEIPEYPLLTEVGAVRSGSFTSPGDGTKFFDDTEYGRGMYYTLDELREIVAYAQARHIEILPEVDLPGHMVAAVTAYPEFSCDPTKKYTVRIDGGISKDVLNVGNDRVIEFLKCVLGHVAEVFPYPYLHIGGDECPTDQWSNNADCLRRVKEEGLAGVHELQSWLVEELGLFLKNEHGKDIVVWDELLSHWSNENTVKPVIMAWNHINKSREAAEKGFKSIVCPYQAVYIDFMQVPAHQTIIDEPYYGGWSDNHVNSLETVYALNPLGALSGKEDFCMGVQANLWAETLNDYEELQYQLLPRMLALAEIGWLENNKKSWDSFYKRLQQQDEILDALGYTYAKHYILPDAQTEEEILMQEVSDILAAGQPGQPGHPAQSVYDELKAIYDVALLMPSDATILTVVKEKLNAYKKAAITQPQEGKLYQIVSASTYYKKQFAGSTMYQDGTQVRFHYTPQLEPEELWYFVKKNNADGPYFHLQNACSKQYLQMPAYNQAVTMGDKATDALRVDLATIASGDFTFVPGAVTLSAVDGYSAAMNNNVKRLSAQTTGLVFAKDDAALCYSGTWRVVEVKDFTAQLKGLLKKCDAILRDAQPGAIGEPSEAALNYLRTQVADPIRHQIDLGDVVSEEAYLGYLERYNEFLAMPKASVMDAISENHYYFIQNAYFTDNYASCTASMLQPKALDKKNDAFYWYFVKNDDGTVTIVNKKTERAAFISKNAEGTIVYANYNGSGNATWTLQEITTDQNATGIAIVDATDTYSWYTNPSAFANVVLKPKNWGASIWNLIQADAIPTGIENIQMSSEAEPLYDLSGRRVTKPTRGIYVNGKGQKVMK